MSDPSALPIATAIVPEGRCQGKVLRSIPNTPPLPPGGHDALGNTRAFLGGCVPEVLGLKCLLNFLYFTEVDLRTMLEAATGYHLDVVEGRCVIETWHRRETWHVIVEPDPHEQLLVIVTAYPVED